MGAIHKDRQQLWGAYSALVNFSSSLPAIFVTPAVLSHPITLFPPIKNKKGYTEAENIPLPALCMTPSKK